MIAEALLTSSVLFVKKENYQERHINISSHRNTQAVVSWRDNREGFIRHKVVNAKLAAENQSLIMNSPSQLQHHLIVHVFAFPSCPDH